MDYKTNHEFRMVSLPARVYSGKDALGNLPAELKRHKARRALVICGRSVSRKTDLINRIKALLGDSCVGLYDEMRKDTPLEDVIAARDLARATQADILIGVGGGSVIQGTRVVAILLAEKHPPEELATQYPEFGAAISPKLLAAKLPIINVLTMGTAAQNRGGSPVKYGASRLEFFDPKTRPVALFWDADALMTAPDSMLRTSGASVLWRSCMDMGYTSASPIAHYNRRQVFEITENALAHIDSKDPWPRIDLCIATYLQNREADDGGGRVHHWPGRVVYAFATSIFNMFEHVGQGEARSALTPTVMRRLGSRDPHAMCRIAETLGVWREGDAVADAPMRAADELEKRFGKLGMPRTLTDIKVPRDSAPTLLENSLKNFNADPKREFVKERDLLREVLDACW